MRIEVACRPHLTDGRAIRLLRTLSRRIPDGLDGLAIVDVYLLQGAVGHTGMLAELFLDPVAQEMSIDSPHLGRTGADNGWDFAVEVAYRAGVTDPEAYTARDAIRDSIGGSGDPLPEVRTAVQFIFRAPRLNAADRAEVVRALYNPLIQQALVIESAEWQSGVRFPATYASAVAPSSDEVLTYDLAAFDDKSLLDLSRNRLLALNGDEMAAIRDYVADPAVVRERGKQGMPRAVTDVELEMIAQTWSEHCKHKIFNAEITYRESGTEHAEVIPSLFGTYIRSTTERLAADRPFLKSVFHDNSGVISFDNDHLVCFKVETHNSPSALDPYGGAITGIVGVNRDILGTGKGAKPIFNTDVLCFGYPDTDPDRIPAGLLHPSRIMEGVHRGIIDGGNQSGIPVVAGGFLFDDSFMGKPLVFCGTGGILPAWIGEEEGWVKHVAAGDFAVMVGGRIGKDGIHGATFSSQQLDESSPTSAVQIGDPITQRKMSDFLLEARDLKLYRGITDNGAGGLSSSLGEMAEEPGGIQVNLDACPLKYPGLAAWEIFVSESQERMSLAVSPDRIEQLLSLAARRDVEAVVIGQFTNSGYIDIDYHGKRVCHVSLDFLHHGLPRMKLSAVWPKAEDRPAAPVAERPAQTRSMRSAISGGSVAAGDLKTLLLGALSDPNVASKEPLVRQFDHEVKGYSVVKPFAGKAADGATDGAVIKPLYQSNRGLTVTHGICPRFSDFDTYDMAMNAVDEAYRAHVILGGDPAQAAVLDNFCWPDPVQSEETPDGEYKLAQLVRACRGLADACLAYRLPLVSGKDSMKNDARIGGRKVSVRPTLLVSLFGIVEDVRKAVTSDFKAAGNALYVSGTTREELGGSVVRRFSQRFAGAGSELAANDTVPRVDPSAAMRLYQAIATAIDRRLIRSAHDLSDGGLGVAVAESAIGGRLGAELDLAHLDVADPKIGDFARLFSESASRILLEIEPEHCAEFEQLVAELPVSRAGRVTEELVVRFLSAERNGETAFDISVDTLLGAWKAEI